MAETAPPAKSRLTSSARVIAALVLLTALSLCAVVLRAVFERDALHLGDPLPALHIQTGGSTISLGPDAPGLVLIMLSNANCEHCHVQLDTLEAALPDLENARLYIVTFPRQAATVSDGPNSSHERWPRLRASSQVTWGDVDRSLWRASFGAAVTPSLFVFRDGKLTSAFRGETGRSALLRVTGREPDVH